MVYFFNEFMRDLSRKAVPSILKKGCHINTVIINMKAYAGPRVHIVRSF